MFGFLLKLSAWAFLLFFVNTCSGIDAPVSRASATATMPLSMVISELSARFKSETPFTVHFAFDDDKLDDIARGRLDAQSAWILSHPNVRFRVQGHTDKQGDVAYNRKLGMRRASNVVTYLASKGVDLKRLVAVVSFGEEMPLVDTERSARVNRRATTQVFGLVAPAERGLDDAGDAAIRLADNSVDSAGGSYENLSFVPSGSSDPSGESPLGKGSSDSDDGSARQPQGGGDAGQSKGNESGPGGGANDGQAGGGDGHAGDHDHGDKSGGRSGADDRGDNHGGNHAGRDDKEHDGGGDHKDRGD